MFHFLFNFTARILKPMPLFTIKDLGELAPAFSSGAGRKLGQALMHLLNVDDLNELYDKVADKHGPDFTSALLEEQGATYRIGGWETLDKLPQGAFITVSNHPYGGLDGIMLIDLMGHLRRDFKVMVNKFLSYIRALEPNFITVIPTGEKRTAPKAESLHGVRQALERLHSGSPVGFFPSGAVSDLHLRERRIRDREWQPAVLRLIRRARVPVLPIRFFDRNSDLYYALGLLSWKIRVLRLPSELLNKAGHIARIGIGDIITPEEQDRCQSLEEFGKMLRDSVYGMALPQEMISREEFFRQRDIAI